MMNGNRTRRYVPAIAACVGICILYAIVGVMVGWKHGGGIIPMMILFALLGATWRAITKQGSRPDATEEAECRETPRNTATDLTGPENTRISAGALPSTPRRDEFPKATPPPLPGATTPETAAQYERTTSPPRKAGKGKWFAFLFLALACAIIAVFFIVQLTKTGQDAVDTNPPRRDPQQGGGKTQNAGPVEPTRTATWETVSIPGLCTLQIPPTMEIQAGTYKRVNDQFRKMVLEISQSQDRVVAQPKGINRFDPAVLGNRYSRIIVETLRGTKGDFLKLDEPLAISESELRELDSALWNQVREAEAASAARGGGKMSILSWQPSSVIHLNDWSAVLTTCRRRLDDNPPVVVRMYKVQNNDVLHTITVSYRESEKDLWADDLDAAITTFRFTKR